MAEIKLTRGLVAIVDEEDYATLSAIKWHATGRGYSKGCVRSGYGGSPVRILMHRYILGLSNDDSRVVDHIDGNPLNNQRSNLRICTHAENCRNTGLTTRNTSGRKGIYLDRRRNRWRARICINGEDISLGYYATADAAHAAYCEAAKRLHGEFVRTSEIRANNKDASDGIAALRDLLGHISDVLTEAEFDKIDTAKWNAVSVIVGNADMATQGENQ
jgi:hypothetical protein